MENLNKHYFIKTYGCQMNVHESEKLAGMLVSLGYTECDNMKDADVIVYNTCCIRDGAEQKVFGNVGSLKNLKKSKPNLVIAVCGCMTQQKGKVDYFKEKYKFVNIIFGTHNLHEFKKYLIAHSNTHKNIYEVWEHEKEIDENVDMYRTSGLNAWVNIMYGCNNFCSYCIVPYVRGRERSRNMDDIVNEVKDLVNSGYKTITLLGQNVNSYGNDIDDKSITFANLLQTIANLEGDFRLKFMTSHPKDLTDEVIDVIANNKKISKAIHLPVQSGSTSILKSMNRKYTREHYLNLVNKIKTKIPDVFLSTDIIVGFPGETDEDFNDTMSLVKEVNYGGLFGFMYSKRSGTVAESMPNQIPDEVKHERVNALLQLSKAQIKEHNKNLVGKTVEVLIESKLEDGTFVGITDSGKNVVINEDVELATYYQAKVNSISGNKLMASIVK